MTNVNQTAQDRAAKYGNFAADTILRNMRAGNAVLRAAGLRESSGPRSIIQIGHDLIKVKSVTRSDYPELLLPETDGATVVVFVCVDDHREHILGCIRVDQVACQSVTVEYDGETFVAVSAAALAPFDLNHRGVN